MHGQPGTLLRIARVEPGALTLDPARVVATPPWTKALMNPKLRRWDHVQRGNRMLRGGGEQPRLDWP